MLQKFKNICHSRRRCRWVLFVHSIIGVFLINNEDFFDRFCRYSVKRYRHLSLYIFDGKINTKNVAIAGKNEPKYPTSGHHKPSVDSIQLNGYEMMIQGMDKIINEMGETMR